MTRTLPVLFLVLSGCTAVRAGVQLQSAAEARDAAAARDAEANAPYEWTMASLYLKKAWEEMGHGAYRSSVLLAKKSAEWSDHAVVQVERGKRTLDVDLDALEAARAERDEANGVRTEPGTPSPVPEPPTQVVVEPAEAETPPAPTAVKVDPPPPTDVIVDVPPAAPAP